MPCDQVRTTTVSLDKIKVESVDLLVEALESLGYTVERKAGRLVARHAERGTFEYDHASGNVKQTTRYGQSATDITDVKVAYSKKVVARVATRFGWKVEQQKAKGGEAARYVATKRSF